MAMNKPAIEGGTPVRKYFLPIGRPLIGQEEKDEVLDTLNSDWISKGPKTKQFGEDFKNYVGCKYTVPVSSCTAGLHIALKAIGVTENDEVITSPLTFVATANTVCYLGAIPVLVDIDRSDFNLDVNLLETKISKRTKAIIPVHFAGLPCEMDRVMEIARRYSIPVIEDAAHAAGAEYNNRKIGSIGDITAFSFYATKNMTTGDGGMVTTDIEELAAKMDVLSFHGLSSDAWERYAPGGTAGYEMIELGYKYNMTDIQASIGIHQLRKLDGFVETRGKYAKLYDMQLSDIPEAAPQKNKPHVRHGRHLYPVVLKVEDLKIDRKGFLEAMKAENIGCGIHYVTLLDHPYYRNGFDFKKDELPNASYISDRILSLPLYPGMTETDVDYVVRAVRKIVAYYRK